MTMFRDSYVACILVDGKVQKETVDGVVTLPFGTEYSIRLGKKFRKRALADVHIDGRVAVKGIIIPENGKLDLERFVDTNLESGNRFKLVPISNAKVEQPDSNENGLVVVNFYAEKDKPVVKIVEHRDYNHHYCHHFGNGHCRQCCWDWDCYICHPHIHWNSGIEKYYCGGLSSHGQVYGSSFSAESRSAGYNTPDSAETVSDPLQGSIFCSSTQNAVKGTTLSANLSRAMNSTGEDAATVEGSLSHQRFVNGSIDADYDHPVVLQLKLKGVSKIIDKCNCGFNRKDENYCPKCGNALAIGVAA